MTTPINTEQQKFFTNLNSMLEICVFSEGSINDADLLEIADKYKEQYQMIKDLMEENRKLKILAQEIQANKYYHKMIKPCKKVTLLTLEEKTKSEKYSPCKFCDNIIKINYKHKHFLNTCCSTNQLKKEFAIKQNPVHKKFNKESQLMNMYIRVCLYDRDRHNNKRNGAYWKTLELMKYNYL